MSLRPKPEIENLKVCPHGGPDYAELKAIGFTLEGILDFSNNSNPFLPPPGVRKMLNTIAINHYPDSKATELRQHLSEKLKVTPDNILVGNGAMELIQLITLTYFRHKDSILILEPTFGEYEIACQVVGANVLKQWTDDSFIPRTEEVISLIKRCHPRGIFICNPNNPTGKYLLKSEIEMILKTCVDSLLIIDEAYVAFVEKSWSSIDLISQSNVIIVRSMTKDYALAGLRLGYAIANKEIINILRKICPPWNVNIVAQQAGIIALGDIDYLERCQQKIKEAKQFLTTELCYLGFTLVPSNTNFFLVRVGDAKVFRAALLKKGILVRDCTSFGLPEYIRIAPGTMSQCQKLVAVIKKIRQRDGYAG